MSDPPYLSTCDALGSAGGTRADTQAYLGLTWSLGGTVAAPRVSAGIRSVEAAGGGRVRGADLALEWQGTGEAGLAFRAVKLGYVSGQPDALVTLGTGYAPSTAEVLGTASVDHGALRVGAEYGALSRKVTPFVTLTSLGVPDIGAGACGAGASLVNPDTSGQNGVIVFLNGPPTFDLEQGFCLVQGPLAPRWRGAPPVRGAPSTLFKPDLPCIDWCDLSQ